MGGIVEQTPQELGQNLHIKQQMLQALLEQFLALVMPILWQLLLKEIQTLLHQQQHLLSLTGVEVLVIGSYRHLTN